MGKIDQIGVIFRRLFLQGILGLLDFFSQILDEEQPDILLLLKQNVATDTAIGQPLNSLMRWIAKTIEAALVNVTFHAECANKPMKNQCCVLRSLPLYRKCIKIRKRGVYCPIFSKLGKMFDSHSASFYSLGAVRKSYLKYGCYTFDGSRPHQHTWAPNGCKKAVYFEHKNE